MTSEQYESAYTERYPSTVGYLVNRGMQHHEAEDCAQQAWLNMWRLHESIERETAGRYACVAAHNAAKNAYKAGQHEVLMPDEDIARHAGTTRINTSAIDARKALAQAGANDAGLMADYYEAGYTSDECAAKYGCTGTAVRIRLYRASQQMRAAIGRGRKLTK